MLLNKKYCCHFLMGNATISDSIIQQIACRIHVKDSIIVPTPLKCLFKFSIGWNGVFE